ncbi:hypothetical protein mRhiFer1_008549 [Rhinolophus ferrumequinum]|uniref:Uncharacterized protein n=1 Tax=Rhinolophus ferrumequinum TaxID=59479 RepID=A0A7J7UJE4_RHIFE|nr:hypothetical protein mRhiFer1_008549 [Rhinolophus ferrumequinum]
MAAGLSHPSYGGEWAVSAGGQHPWGHILLSIAWDPVVQKPFPIGSKVLGCQPNTQTSGLELPAVKGSPTLPCPVKSRAWAIRHSPKRSRDLGEVVAPGPVSEPPTAVPVLGGRLAILCQP